MRAHEANIVTTVKQMVKQMDPDQPVTGIHIMDDMLGTYMSGSVSYATVLGVFAGMAAILAATGVFGVLSYFVNQRTREMGIRLALGAQRGAIFALVAELGLALVGTGLTIGVALALALNGFMKEHFWLYHIKTTDPPTYAAVAILFLSIALLACYLPARRATNLDPMAILRHE